MDLLTQLLKKINNHRYVVLTWQSVQNSQITEHAFKKMCALVQLINALDITSKHLLKVTIFKAQFMHQLT